MPDEDSKQLQEEHKQPAAEEIGYTAKSLTT
jgi:hypothetical protein